MPPRVAPTADKHEQVVGNVEVDWHGSQYIDDQYHPHFSAGVLYLMLPGVIEQQILTFLQDVFLLEDSKDRWVDFRHPQGQMVSQTAVIGAFVRGNRATGLQYGEEGLGDVRDGIDQSSGDRTPLGVLCDPSAQRLEHEDAPLKTVRHPAERSGAGWDPDPYRWASPRSPRAAARARSGWTCSAP